VALHQIETRTTGVVIWNVLLEEIDRVEGVWHLANADLRHRQWAD
jgi:hypothetical protein